MKKRLAIVVFLVVGCASYQKRKACEKENWFQYGFDVAMSGKRLSGDPKILDCRRVEAKIDEGQLDVGFKAGMEKYCQPEVVLALGKKGEFFSSEFCYPAKVPALKTQHEAGVKQFCQKSNGFAAGTSGFVYNQICPDKLETAFLPEYRRGRKKFLGGRIEQSQQRKTEITQSVDRLERDRHALEMERALLSSRRVLVRDRIYDPGTGKYAESERWEEDPSVANRRWSLDSEITFKNSEIQKLRKEEEALNGQISKDRGELQGLDE